MTSGSDQANIYRRWTWVFITLIGAGCIVGIAVPAGLGWDFANFYDAGRRVAAGQFADLYSPLSPIGGQPPQGSTGFFGAPLSAVLYVPLAAFPARTALIAFKIENVLAFAAIFTLLLKFYRPFAGGTRLEESRFTALFAFLFLIYQPFWTIFRVGGQTTPTVLLILVVGLIAHTNGRFWESAIAVVLAALIKPSLAPAVILLACISEFRFVWRMAVLWAGAGALSILLLGWPVHVVFLENMLYRSQLNYSWYYNSSLDVLLITLREYFGSAAAAGLLDWLLRLLTYALKVVVVFTVIGLWLRSRRESWTLEARRHFVFSMAMVFYLVWSPTVYEHYLSLLFPFLIYVIASHSHFSRRALILVALIFLFSIGQNLILINLIRYGFEVDSLPELVAAALFKSAPLVLTLVLLWGHRGELLRSHAAPAWNA